GESLSDLVRRAGGTLAPRTLLPVLLQVARALQAVHAAGVVHRDLKPGNVLVTATGTAKLTDFGISLADDQAPMTAAGRVMGTAQYLSPEQVTGQPARPAGDLYALGVVAYEALVGHRPFSGATDVDIAVAHVHDPVPELPATVPGPVRAVVARLLAKDPGQRPADAGELARVLAEVIEQLHDDDTPPAHVRGATRLALPLGVLGLGSLTLADSVALGEAADAPPTPTTTKDG
ncbi:serine/threonine-protein kinase, partial [Georgenia sp. 10Sc9-8]|nr:serine/threonine-protein kinase [Georgenia halotolerans]